MTKAQIVSLLSRNNRAVERALVALYHRQTVDEQTTSTTKHSNGVGFNAKDAEYATYLARWVMSGRRLTGHHLVAGRRIATYYARQLAEMSVAPACPPRKVYKLYSEEEMCVAIAHWDRFQDFPGVTQGL